MVRRLADQAEARRLVDATGGGQHVIGPKRELPVTDCAGAGDAGVHEPTSDAPASGRRFDIKESEPGDRRIVAADEEDRADDRAQAFGDPGALALGIVPGDKFAQDLRDQSLVGPVPAIFVVIEDGLAMDDPAEVPRRDALRRTSSSVCSAARTERMSRMAAARRWRRS